MAEVVLKNVIKEYLIGSRVIHGINLNIKDGEFMVLVGPSGCGKSTLLRMIAGLEDITDGEIWIGDKCANNIPPKDRGIAMVFQSYALYPHMTAYENMAFGLKLQKLPKDEIDKRVREAASKLELTGLLDKKPKEMSGGQRQRVAVGRAIVRKPEVFLFDEPLSNLDAKLRAALRVELKELHNQLKKEGSSATIIYVTHDQVEAMTLGDRICVLSEGRIMQVDTPYNLYYRPANKFVANFIGSPPMNTVEATVFHDNGKVGLKVGSCSVYLTGEKANKVKNHVNKKVWLGIRPEHIKCVKSEDSENVVEGTITAVEQLGNEELIYFEVDGEKFIAAEESRIENEFKVGAKCCFYFNEDDIHVFDYENEENITLKEAPKGVAI